MNLTISGHHLELTPALREYVQTKLERIKRHFDQVIDVGVILTVEKITEKERRQKAEINLLVRGKDLHVESLAHDLYAPIIIPCCISQSPQRLCNTGECRAVARQRRACRTHQKERGRSGNTPYPQRQDCRPES